MCHNKRGSSGILATICVFLCLPHCLLKLWSWQGVKLAQGIRPRGVTAVPTSHLICGVQLRTHLLLAAPQRGCLQTLDAGTDTPGWVPYPYPISVHPLMPAASQSLPLLRFMEVFQLFLLFVPDLCFDVIIKSSPGLGPLSTYGAGQTQLSSIVVYFRQSWTSALLDQPWQEGSQWYVTRPGETPLGKCVNSENNKSSLVSALISMAMGVTRPLCPTCGLWRQRQRAKQCHSPVVLNQIMPQTEQHELGSLGIYPLTFLWRFSEQVYPSMTVAALASMAVRCVGDSHSHTVSLHTRCASLTPVTEHQSPWHSPQCWHGPVVTTGSQVTTH